MLKETEVRIGNFVLDSNKNIVRIDALNLDGNLMQEDRRYDDNYKAIVNPKGVPLTPDLLYKIGFITLDAETDTVVWGLSVSNGEEFSIVSDGLDTPVPLYFEYDLGYSRDVRKEVKYLHELQNLYFALTGKELEIKL